MMKKVIMMLIVLFSCFGCSGASDKGKGVPEIGDDSSSENNETSNNGSSTSNNASENNAPNNSNNTENNISDTDECPDGSGMVSVDGTDECVPLCPDENCAQGRECVDGFCLDETDTGTCTTRDECEPGHECVDGECLPHLDCSDSVAEGCYAVWSGCEDEVVYEIQCDFETCTCLENESVVDQVDHNDLCEDLDTIHVAANTSCNWRVPQIVQ